MAFDSFSFALGVVAAVVFYFVWKMISNRTSYYEPPEFPENMTTEQAIAIHDQEFKKLTEDYNKNMASVQNVDQGDKIVTDYKEAIGKLAAKMSVFEMKRAQATESPEAKAAAATAASSAGPPMTAPPPPAAPAAPAATGTSGFVSGWQY
jgi:hypothetical protein